MKNIFILLGMIFYLMPEMAFPGCKDGVPASKQRPNPTLSMKFSGVITKSAVDTGTGYVGIVFIDQDKAIFRSKSLETSSENYSEVDLHLESNETVEKLVSIGNNDFAAVMKKPDNNIGRVIFVNATEAKIIKEKKDVISVRRVNDGSCIIHSNDSEGTHISLYLITGHALTITDLNNKFGDYDIENVVCYYVMDPYIVFVKKQANEKGVVLLCKIIFGESNRAPSLIAMAHTPESSEGEGLSFIPTQCIMWTHEEVDQSKSFNKGYIAFLNDEDQSIAHVFPVDFVNQRLYHEKVFEVKSRKRRFSRFINFGNSVGIATEGRDKLYMIQPKKEKIYSAFDIVYDNSETISKALFVNKLDTQKRPRLLLVTKENSMHRVTRWKLPKDTPLFRAKQFFCKTGFFCTSRLGIQNYDREWLDNHHATYFDVLHYTNNNVLVIASSNEKHHIYLFNENEVLKKENTFILQELSEPPAQAN